MSFEVAMLQSQQVAIFDNAYSNEEIARWIALSKDQKDEKNAFFVVNLKFLLDKYDEWKRELPDVEPYYAVKCNDDPVILKVLAELGLGFDCASINELDMVLKDKLVRPEKVIFAHTIKQPEALLHAKRMEVCKMTFDNSEELDKIKRIYPDAQLLLRIAAVDPSAIYPFNDKFGCQIKDGLKLLQKAADLDLNVIGIAFHVGSGCRNFMVYKHAMSNAKILFDAGLEYGLKLHVLDIGGGFPGGAAGDPFSFTEMAKHIRTYLNEFFPKTTGIKIAAEPGRYFATPMCTVVANVIAATRISADRITKDEHDDGKPGYMYYLNDGFFGTFNGIYYENIHVQGRPLFKSTTNTDEYPSKIWGPTCAGRDLIEPNSKLRKLDVGEWLFYHNLGSYTFVKATRFNGFPLPQCYYVMDSDTWHHLYPERNIFNKQLNRDVKELLFRGVRTLKGKL